MQWKAASCLALFLVLQCAVCAAAEAAKQPAAVSVEQIISREDPAFNCAKARLAVGRDGMVYLANPAAGDLSYILRLTLDGQKKICCIAPESVNNVTANRDGVVACANGHFKHQVTLLGKDLVQEAAVADFLNSDAVGWDAPAFVEAGDSGDFYGIDQHRDRILRINPQGKTVNAYALPHIEGHPAQNIRVCEKNNAFYVIDLTRAQLRCVGFDGALRWEKNVGISSNTYEGNNGGFDVDPQGMLYVIRSGERTIHMFGTTGDPAGQIELDVPADRKPVEGINELRVYDGNAVIKSRHPSELFQVYDLATGKFKRAVDADHERLAITTTNGQWTAGQTVDFRIDFDGGGWRVSPRWRVWARPFGVLDYRSLTLAGEKLEVPADFAGFYQVKVTPEVNPWQTDSVPGEYKVQTVVEVRRSGSEGTASVATPLNRTWFGRGEEVPFTVYLRGIRAAKDTQLAITLEDGSKAVAGTVLTLAAGATQEQFAIPGWLTARLTPGRYVLTPTSDLLTCVKQPIIIGPGPANAAFLTTVYGDYGATYPQASALDAPDVATAAVRRSERLGFNMMVDRLGVQLGALSPEKVPDDLESLRKSAEADPEAIAPQKLFTLPTLLRAQGQYGASGITQMGILMGNDAGLPLGGPGFDSRKPDQLLKDLTTATEALKGFPSFRGWSWSSNWWVFEARDAKAAKTPAEKAEYEAAIKRAGATGAWDPVLETVSDNRLSYAVDAQALFNQKLKELAPAAVTAVACPFRNVESYPPVTFSNVDEVDLQAQWEQIALPYHGPFGVDFYKRPDKKAFAHPEVWNDAGTGDQILTTLWQTIMRGADGVGCSGTLPHWDFALVGNTDDPRLSWNGEASVYRNLNGVLKQYGPWLASLQNNDKVAIVASSRMYKIDRWENVTGKHFARVMEAYITCLHAHLPASIVFAEDATPDSLKGYKAVLVVDQTVEMDPPLGAAIDAARNAGVAIFADGACRPELVKGYAPLGVSFDHLGKDPSPAGDDAAYWRIAGYARANLPEFTRALAAVKPAAQVENPDVFITERKAGTGRYLFVVNNSVPQELDPANLWRVSLAETTLVPQVVPVKLDLAEGEAVYDVLAGKRVQPADGVVRADCRSMPARIYAILPEPIDRVRIAAPASAAWGQTLPWTVDVLGAAGRDAAPGKAIVAAIPVRVRLLAPGGVVLYETYVSSTDKGAGGQFILPINLPAREVTIEATELFSGCSAKSDVALPDKRPDEMHLTDLRDPGACMDAAPKQVVESAVRSADFAPAGDSFGPHVRDITITSGGKLAVLNAMNWDHNLYGVDLETGQVRWRQRAGHYFAFDPIALSDGIAVQGFDLKSPQGYHLYRVGADGTLHRRFALYGLPQRLPHRFVPALVRDHIDSFAVGDDGKWVATAGDMGLAVWSGDGTLRWRQDWYKQQRHTGKVIALDSSTLLVIEGTTATAYGAADGREKWRQSLWPAGECRIARVSADASTCALFDPVNGGILSILREGRVIRAIPTPAEDVALSADGSRIAVVARHLLKLYSLTDGLQWALNGDDAMHFPRFSADGRLAASSSLGTVYVTDLDGKTLLEKDLHALAAPAWLRDGSLVLATWEGTVCRLNPTYATQWLTHLSPETDDMHGKLLAEDRTPTTGISDWGNATNKPADIADNLLSKATPLIRLVPSGNWGGDAQFRNTNDQKVSMLYDGKAGPPPQPWIPWNYVGLFAETSPINYVLVDAFRQQLKVTGATLVEDPDHPESWLRDASIDYWDVAAERWVPIQPLLSNAPVHTHVFAKPVEAARFRIMLPWGDCGNLRLAEIAFHGELAGCSHPDVIAKRPLAVLFDEQDDIKADLMHSGNGLSFSLQGAYSGGRCLTLTPKTGAQATAAPLYQQQFGHTIRNWDFEIAEKPEPGQYRYLQFAWRGEAGATGIGLSVAAAGAGQRAFTAGEVKLPELTTGQRISDAVPGKWTIVRVDLWEAFKKPVRVQAMTLMAAGGAAQFDQIVLGRSEEALPAEKK